MQNPASSYDAQTASYADPMYQLLRDGDVVEFNRLKAAGQSCDLTHCDLRSLDLRGVDAAGLDFSHCYSQRQPAGRRFLQVSARRREPQ